MRTPHLLLSHILPASVQPSMAGSQPRARGEGSCAGQCLCAKVRVKVSEDWIHKAMERT